MTYEDLCYLEDKAWTAFLNVFEEAGASRKELRKCLDNKDCFNEVSDAVMDACRNLVFEE